MTEMKLKFGSMLLMAIVMGGMMIVLEAPGAEAQIIPEIDVVTGGSVTLDVSPSGTGLGGTTVTVSNSALDASVRVRVTIDVSSYQISPQQTTINLPPASEKTFPVSVAATLRTPYQMRAAQVHAVVTHVNGIPFEGVSEADAGFFILTEAYGKVILQSDKPFQRLSPGKEFPFKLKVVNVGNAIDTFSVEVTNKDQLSKKGFSISLSSTTTKNTDPQTYDLITVQIQTPREFGWKNEYHNLDLKAISEVEGRGADYSITVWVHGFGVSGFEPLYSIVAIALVGAFFMKRKGE